MICSMVGSTREQNGHWKSDHSTIVTLACSGPLAGALPTGTLKRSTLESGSAAVGTGPLLSPLPLFHVCPMNTPTTRATSIPMIAVPLLMGTPVPS